ncbi:DUF2946 family protein [Bradyrhizobium prioriisuperbiae]|uniref:DUF2946 family protein n=1 Tax=Bradyrhizobium prioriisuperbiae TaxID=2854389 RepID=UPI0028EA70B7|nr:hypothetical protein [Bradyrhizobium prioritasuperba]
MRYSGKRILGMCAAGAAAYALVLNVILSSILLATLSPTAVAAGYELCANSADIRAVRDDAGKTEKRAIVHCPLCIGHHAGIALSSPSPISLERIASVAPLAFEFIKRCVEFSRTHDHQPRGPPVLI